MWIKKEFKHLESFLVGEPKQFIVVAGETYCVREDCENCPYYGKCETEEEIIPAATILPARRAIGYEERPFLVLELQEGKEFRPLLPEEVNPNVVPQHLWNHSRDHFSKDPRNLHYILSDLKHVFRVMKGQYRYYGTEEEFNNSEYASYFTIYSKYTPQHHLVAFDFSAVEPRGSAIASREIHWLKIYEGNPKVIVRQVEVPDTEDKEYLYRTPTGETYCMLLGELDKARYDMQCDRCKISCKIIKEYRKSVPGDFHAINAKAFFANEPDWPIIPEGQYPTSEQSAVLAKYRNIAKICGLAATYGANAYTLMGHMNCSKEEAQRRLDSFFSLLTQAKQNMLHTESRVLRTGKISNFFGRILRLERWAFSKEPDELQRKKDVSYAVRMAYNYPIQSSMAEILKLAMLRVNKLIQERGLNPLYGNKVPQNIRQYSYADIICAMLFSIHDEIDFHLTTEKFDTLIPELYKTLQVSDVMKKFGVDFSLEMDVEYDNSQSFTAEIKYQPAKIHLLQNILPNLERNKNLQPNMFVIPFEKINSEILQTGLNFSQEQHNIVDEGVIAVGIQNGNDLYVFPKQIPVGLLRELGEGQWVHFSDI